MLIQYGTALGDYLYDVFVAKFDFWLAFGLAAQLLFTARFLVQWISSERAGQSVVPMAFWFFSMGGGLMTLVYGIAKREPVIIIGQSLATIIYIRNIMLIVKNRGRASKTRPRPRSMGMRGVRERRGYGRPAVPGVAGGGVRAGVLGRRLRRDRLVAGAPVHRAVRAAVNGRGQISPIRALQTLHSCRRCAPRPQLRGAPAAQVGDRWAPPGEFASSPPRGLPRLRGSSGARRRCPSTRQSQVLAEHSRVPSSDAQQRQGGSFWHASALLPVAERVHADP